ncbi:MAG: YjjW family glycine radical enzyme activase [Actinomycetota bacterium]
MTAPVRAPLLLHHPVVIAPGSAVLEVAGVVKSSAVDGPGNRYVLFLQGCNFDCSACHNPSTIGRCDACGACVPACPHGALSFPAPGVLVYGAASCDRCRACVAVCPIDADPAIRVAPIGEIVEEIRTLARFLSGVTVTGGEPTIQAEALAALFFALKADPELGRLTTLVDTNGTLPAGRWSRLLPVLDGAMVDLKAASSELHRNLTGHDNDQVKETIRFLSSVGKLAEVRLLVVEGVTDTAAELEAWAGFVGGVDRGVPVRLMAFRHTGTRLAGQRWPETSPETLQRVRDRLLSLGLTAVHGVMSPARLTPR